MKRALKFLARWSIFIAAALLTLPGMIITVVGGVILILAWSIDQGPYNELMSILEEVRGD